MHEMGNKTTGRPGRASRFASGGLILIAFILLVLAIYANTLDSPFIFDDERVITANPAIQLTELNLDSIVRVISDSPIVNRPVANLSFALNYYLHGFEVRGYHVVNIIIHLVNGILLYLLVRVTMRIDPQQSAAASVWIPLTAALLWLAHPVQTQTVTYIVQRMNSMAAMFYVLSLLLYIYGRLTEKRRGKWGLFAGCAVSGGLALGSKEIAATLPVIILLYEWYFFRDLDKAWLKKFLLCLLGISVAIALLVFLYIGKNPLQVILLDYADQDFTLFQRVLTQFRVVIHYISLLLFPHPYRFNLNHDFTLSYSLFSPAITAGSIVAVCALLSLTVFSARRHRLISFCLLWFFINLLIESSVIALEMVYDHRTYLPSMLFSLLVVLVVCRFVRSGKLRILGAIAVVLVFSLLSHERNKLWLDEITLWQDCVAKSPNLVRTHMNLANILDDRGRGREAIDHYLKALAINPYSAKVYYNYGLALERQRKIPMALENYYKAVFLDPDYLDAHYQLAAILASRNEIRKAVSHYREVLRIGPGHPNAQWRLNVLLRSLKMNQGRNPADNKK